MKLFYKKMGEGHPLIIMHGLFGQSDNWNTLGKQFALQGFEVYIPDLRNHGKSPHSDEWNYTLMCEDIIELVNEIKLSNNHSPILLGHSMGGKVAMLCAIKYPSLLKKIVIVDIAPKYHLPDNNDVIEAFKAIDITTLQSRKEAEMFLANFIKDTGIKQFMLKNIYWKENKNEYPLEGELQWRFNIKAILHQLVNISEEIKGDNPCYTPALFIRGSKSDYVLDTDFASIKKLFPNSVVITITKAGHWVHADNPTEFYENVIAFIKK